MSSSLNKINSVEIDSSGVFKYILIEVRDKKNRQSKKILVRGYQHCYYHADILEEVEDKLRHCDIECLCLGGGRIDHDSDAKQILVYGYSQGFGRANHQTTVELLKQKYPDYEISYNNEGY